MSRGIHGLRPWLIQRISAVYLAAFLCYLLVHVLIASPLSAGAWRDWVALPHVAMLFALFFSAILLHAWVGVRDVLLDYVQHAGMRLMLLAVLILSLAANAFWVFYLLFSNTLKVAGAV